MNQEEKELLKELLSQRRVATVAVLLEGEPYTGLLPFTVLPDFSGFLVHASTLARHTKGLQPGAPFSLLIHEPEGPGSDPLQMPRVSFQGKVTLLDKASQEYQAAQDIYTRKYPDSKGIFGFQDFNLYRLDIEKGRFVAAFGRIFNLAGSTMRTLSQTDPGITQEETSS